MMTGRFRKDPDMQARRSERRQKSLDRAFARAALLFPTMLFAAGIALCLFYGQALTLPTWDVVGWTFLCTFILCVIAYNNWTLLGTAVVAGIAALIAWRAIEPEELELLIESVSGQLAYVWAFLFEYGEHDPEFDAALFGCIIAVCSALSTLFVYRLRSALLATILALAMFMIEWSLGAVGILAALWPTAIACAMVFGLRGFRHASRRPVQAVALATAVALIASGAGALIVPARTDGIRSASVERVLDNFTDLFSDYTGYQRPHSAFSIARVGYQPLGDRLGGAVELPDIDLLRVSTTSPGLLRGMVRNYYSGSLWTRSASIKTYRMDNPFMMDTQDRVMGIDLPDEPDLEEAFAREIDITVTHVGDMAATLFTVGRVRGIRAGQSDIITNYDENGEAFAKRALAGGSSYTVSARVPTTSGSAFSGVMETLYYYDRIEPTPDEARQRNAFLYLGLPDDFPDWVGELADQVVSDARAANDWEKAAALMNYLRSNYAYTLTPGDPPEGVDFVAHFLQTGEGYCTYFASAMAVMARTQGLPSRYVEGFLLNGSRRTDKGYVVNAKQAHAWAEVYIEGVGWLAFDATPRQTTSSGASAAADYFEPPIYTPPPETPTDLTDTDIGPVVGRFEIPWWVWPPLAVIALVALFFILLSRQARRWDSERLAARWPDGRDRIVVIWRDLHTALSMMGLGIRPGETALTWAERIDKAYDNPEGRLATIADAYVRAVYGGIAPDDKLLGQANAYRGEADVALRKAAGRFRFLFQRALRSMPEP